MDPILCCLLGICCPPLERRDKMIAHFESLGLNETQAEAVANDVIARVDTFMQTELSTMLKQIAKGHKS